MSNHEKKKGGTVPHKVLSDRGVFLEKAHQATASSSIHYGRSVVVCQNGCGDDIIVKIGQRCPSCRRRVRGPNHVNGAHHRGVVPKCTK